MKIPGVQLPQLPLRVDFAGGWLDVPKFSRDAGFVVNCAISPMVSLAEWPYQIGGGLGGSAAWHILHGRDCKKEEAAMGAGWQDEAVVRETGLCVWLSGATPVLYWKSCESEMKDLLRGRMAVVWTGKPHSTQWLVDRPRNYDLIEAASDVAHRGVMNEEFDELYESVGMSYQAQIEEGMEPLAALPGATQKYCGAGQGGYALYLFRHPELRHRAIERSGKDSLIPVEPYLR